MPNTHTGALQTLETLSPKNSWWPSGSLATSALASRPSCPPKSTPFIQGLLYPKSLDAVGHRNTSIRPKSAAAATPELSSPPCPGPPTHLRTADRQQLFIRAGITRYDCSDRRYDTATLTHLWRSECLCYERQMCAGTQLYEPINQSTTSSLCLNREQQSEASREVSVRAGGMHITRQSA